MTNHHNVNHLGRRDFVCPHESCARAFGYKHLLQRHLGKLHKASDGEYESSDDSETGSAVGDNEPQQRRGLRVDDITGMAYSKRAQQQMESSRSLCCPFPDLQDLLTDGTAASSSDKRCEYVFTRAYDFRRHLRSEHGLDAEKDEVDAWVKSARKAKNWS